MSGAQAAIDHCEGRDREGHVHEIVLTVMTRIDMLILACEVCLNERVLSGLREDILRYAIFLCVCG
jgi:hypothetical protein